MKRIDFLILVFLFIPSFFFFASLANITNNTLYTEIKKSKNKINGLLECYMYDK